MSSRLVASFGGVGYAPVAPGTVGSAVALGIGGAAMMGPGWLLPVMVAGAVVAGFKAIPRAVTDRGADPSWVVIDEVAGQWSALLGLEAPSWAGLGAAFVLFRVLDIWKPGPIGWADRRYGAFGVMMDDVLAGGFVALALVAVRRSGLGWLG